MSGNGRSWNNPKDYLQEPSTFIQKGYIKPNGFWSKSIGAGRTEVSKYLTPDRQDLCYSRFGVNTPPFADAGPDQQVIDSNGSGDEQIQLDGSGSTDPDFNIVEYNWTWAGGSATGVNPFVTVPVGTTVITLEVVDSDGATDTDTMNATVLAVDPPTLVVSPAPTGVYEGDEITYTATPGGLGLVGVRWYLDEILQETDTSAPYEFTYTAPHGVSTVRAEAYNLIEDTTSVSREVTAEKVINLALPTGNTTTANLATVAGTLQNTYPNGKFIFTLNGTLGQGVVVDSGWGTGAVLELEIAVGSILTGAAGLGGAGGFGSFQDAGDGTNGGITFQGGSRPLSIRNYGTVVVAGGGGGGSGGTRRNNSNAAGGAGASGAGNGGLVGGTGATNQFLTGTTQGKGGDGGDPGQPGGSATRSTGFGVTNSKNGNPGGAGSLSTGSITFEISGTILS